MPMAIEQRTGAAATAAIVGVIAGYALTLTGHPFWGFAVFVLTVVLGGIGLLMAASPRVAGGMLSLAAVVLGLIGLGVSALVMIGVAIF